VRRARLLKLVPADSGEAPLRVPDLPETAAAPSFADQTASALRAALAPWRALADAAWGGTWAGMVEVGLARAAHR
ncbi:MAG: hypothetical protein KGL53_03105, partial [Elusimicrobia bacterium]|nr:hypothetical protein [Elusimicrobiota bacterium]